LDIDLIHIDIFEIKQRVNSSYFLVDVIVLRGKQKVFYSFLLALWGNSHILERFVVFNWIRSF